MAHVLWALLPAKLSRVTGARQSSLLLPPTPTRSNLSFCVLSAMSELSLPSLDPASQVRLPYVSIYCDLSR